MESSYGEKHLIPGVSWVVNTVTGHTGQVYKMLPKFGAQVWNKKDQTRENWFWSILTVRIPRSIKRYPRPLRFAREVPTEQCHCPSGREKVENEHSVRCLKCKKLIGSESFPKRLARAEVKLRKAYLRRVKKENPRGKIPRGKRRPGKATPARGPIRPKKRRKASKSRVRQLHGGRIAKNKAHPKRAKVSAHPKVSPPRGKTKRSKSR
jgi:hypothetical protein